GEKVCAVWWRQGGDEELRLALGALQRLPAHTGAALSLAEAHLRRTGINAPIGDAAGSGEAEAGRGDLPERDAGIQFWQRQFDSRRSLRNRRRYREVSLDAVGPHRL